MPNRPATMSIWTGWRPSTLRERKIRSGSSGVRGRRLAGDEAGEQRDRQRPEAERAAPSAQPWSAASTIV